MPDCWGIFWIFVMLIQNVWTRQWNEYVYWTNYVESKILRVWQFCCRRVISRSINLFLLMATQSFVDNNNGRRNNQTASRHSSSNEHHHDGMVSEFDVRRSSFAKKFHISKPQEVSCFETDENGSTSFGTKNLLVLECNLILIFSVNLRHHLFPVIWRKEWTLL